MNPGRTINHIRNEKGIALVAALCISAVLLIFAIALTYRMATYLKMLATSKEKNQSYYTSVTGTEQLRDRLRTPPCPGPYCSSICRPPNWCNLLGIAGDITNPAYSDITFFATGMASPAKFPNTPENKDIFYTLLLKDNDEFDGDYTSDSDELIIAVATSTGNNETRTSIEAGLLFDAAALSPYKGGAQDAARTNTTNQTNINTAAGTAGTY